MFFLLQFQNKAILDKPYFVLKDEDIMPPYLLIKNIPLSSNVNLTLTRWTESATQEQS